MLNTIERKVSEIKPYKENAKKHSETQIKNVAESIRQFGFRQPIVLDKDDVIIIGHCRYEAAKLLNMETVPCNIAAELSKEQVRKLRNLDNKLNESEWDFDLLREDISDLDFSDFDIDWDLPEVENKSEIIEDEAPEVDEENEPITQLGDIWELGEHRLMCGDSTDAAAIDRLMNGKKADLVFTDPPYGMKKENEGVINDNLNYDDLLKFNKQWIPLTFDALKDNGSWYCWGIDEPLMDIYSEILKPMQKANKITFRNLITWDKGSGQGQLSSEYRMFAIADEKCLFIQKGIQCLTLNADQYWEEYEPIRLYLLQQRNICGWNIPTMKQIAGHSDKSRDHWTGKSQWNLPTEDIYIKFQNWARENGKQAFLKPYEQLRAEYEQLRAYFDNTHDNMNNVWHFSKTSGEERELCGGHATPKPIALCARAIKSSSREGETVLDVFGGSGSTLIACEQLGRRCYMMELSPKYCDVIIKRWEKLTGKKAVRINVESGETADRD